MAGTTVSFHRIAWIAVLAFPLWISGCGNKEPVQKPMPPKASKAAPAPVIAQAEQQTSPEATYRYNPDGRRDPFRSLLAQENEKKMSIHREDLPPLQRYGVDEFVLGGITWDEKSAMALVRGPDGKGYILKPGTLLGPNGGVVTKITPSTVVVHEKAKDYRGKETTREIVLELHRAEEGKK